MATVYYEEAKDRILIAHVSFSQGAANVYDTYVSDRDFWGGEEQYLPPPAYVLTILELDKLIKEDKLTFLGLL